MRKFRDKLELTYKSVRIRNIQRILIAVQLILIISLSVLILAISGVSLRPFYFPLDFVLFFLIVMLLVFSLEAIFFRVLEIGYSTNYSAIHFMTKNSLRRATALLVFSVLILATPLLVTYAKGELSESGNAAVTIGDPTYLNLTNRDRLALTETTSINVTIQSGAEVRIWLMTSEDFENAVASGNFGSETATLVIPTTRTVNLPKSLLGKNYEEYVVRIVSTGSSQINYRVDIEPSPFIISFIPLLATISIIAQGIWIAYLYPMKRRYAPLSIYSQKFVHEAKTSHRTYTPITETPSPPPPPPRKAVGTYIKAGAEVSAPEETVSVDTILMEARKHYNNRNYEAALREFDRALKVEENHLMAISGKGKTLETLDRLEESLECYDKALALNPKAEFNWVRTGDMLLKLDRKEEAVERFKTAIALNPSSPAMEKLKSIEKDKGFLKTQAAHFSDEGKFREALRYYTLILRHDTENIKALIGMSVALRGMKRFDDAEKALKKVLDIDYYNSLALDELAKCYRDRLAQEPRDVDAWIARGDILVELGRKEEGLMCFNKALDVNPDYEEAKIRVQDMNPAPVWEGHMKEDVIQEFVKIPGIGRARANALIEAGYDSMKKLEKASMKDVAAVKGIDQRLARGIIASVRPYG